MKITIEKLITLGTCCLVFLSPWQTRWILEQGMINGNASEYLTLSVYGIDLLIILLIVAKIKNCNFKFEILNLKSISNVKCLNLKTLAGILFIAWCASSVLWAADKTLAAQHIVWLLLAAGLTWLVVKHENKGKLMFWFLAGLTVSAWLGIWQFVTQTTFANKWLGLALHGAALGGTSVVETVSNGLPARWLRAYGSFDHPNIFGMAMMVGILLILADLKRTVRDSSNSSLADSPLIKYIAIVSMSAGLFASLSRSAWLGLVIGIVSLGVLLLRSKLRSKLRNTPTVLVGEHDETIKSYNYFKAVAVVAIVFLMMGFAYKEVIMVRADGSARLEKKSLDDRTLYLQQAKEIIRQNPVFGVGAGNYVKTLHKENPDNPAWTYQPVHNVFLLIWAELGIFAMLALVAFLGGLLIYAWRSGNILGVALLASLVPSVLLDHWLWSLHFGVLFLGLVVGLILKNDSSVKDCQFKSSTSAADGPT